MGKTAYGVWKVFLLVPFLYHSFRSLRHQEVAVLLRRQAAQNGTTKASGAGSPITDSWGKLSQLRAVMFQSGSSTHKTSRAMFVFFNTKRKLKV